MENILGKAESYVIKKFEDQLSQRITYHNLADKIERIAQIILSTRIPQKPVGILEEIICDADLSYSGKKIFSSHSQRLRVEWENMLGKKFSDYEWLKTNINFLKENKFHTKYAKLLYNEQRKKNLAELQQKLIAYKITPPPKHKSL